MKSSIHARKIKRAAFSLVELIVVIGIIALLISILMPALSKARRQGEWIKCQSNLRQVGVALTIYMDHYRGWMFPVGPDMPDPNDTVNTPPQMIPSTYGTNYAPHERWPMRDCFKISTAVLPPPYNPASYTGQYDPITFNAQPYTPPFLICPTDPDAFEAHSYLLNQHLADKRIRYWANGGAKLSSSEVILMGEKKTTIRDYYMESKEFDNINEAYRHGLTYGSNYLYKDGHVDTKLPDAAKTDIDPWDPKTNASPTGP